MCNMVCAVNECDIRARGGCYCECLKAGENKTYEPLNVNTKPIEGIYGGTRQDLIEKGFIYIPPKMTPEQHQEFLEIDKKLNEEGPGFRFSETPKITSDFWIIKSIGRLFHKRGKRKRCRKCLRRAKNEQRRNK